MLRVIQTAEQELAAGRACELVILLSVRVTAPREAGCAMLVGNGGTLLAGTVGGGNTERTAILTAAKLLETRTDAKGTVRGGDGGCAFEITLQYFCCDPGNASLLAALRECLQTGSGTVAINTDGKAASFLAGNAAFGQVKQGETVFLYCPARERVLLFGAGHVAQALCPLLPPLGFSVTICDSRPELCRGELFPAADRLITDTEAAIAEAAAGDNILLMTATHESDEALLGKLADQEYAYLGMLGSQKKAEKIFRHLREKGVSEEALASVHVPVGLSIGAETPEEIAVSVAAELIMIRSEKRKAGMR